MSKGLFEEPAPGRFALNEAAQPLLEDSTRLGLDLDNFGGRMLQICRHIAEPRA
ncbi:MAG: hydroxyneurosporene-O-methyltransferase [Bryobacterales bacterium]|nr:hydroxyneurosporene-O-methyltransferase [Bryobacterales bacterium]